MFKTSGWSSSLFPPVIPQGAVPTDAILPSATQSIRPAAPPAPPRPALPQKPFIPPVLPPARPQITPYSVIEASLIEKAEQETDSVAKVTMYMEMAMKRIENGFLDETMMGFCKKASEIVYSENQKYSYHSKIESVLPILFNEILKISEKLYGDEPNLAIGAIEMLSPFSVKLQKYDLLKRVPNLVHKIISAGGQTGSEVFLVKMVTNDKQIERENFSNLDGGQRAKLDKLLLSLKTNSEKGCYNGYQEDTYNYNYITRSEAETLFNEILHPQKYANNFTAVLGGGISKGTGLKSSKKFDEEYMAIYESGRAALPPKESPEASDSSPAPPSSSDEGVNAFSSKWLATEEKSSPEPIKKETGSFSNEEPPTLDGGNFDFNFDITIPETFIPFPQDTSD